MKGLHGKNLYFWPVPGSIIPDENEGHPGVQINRRAKKRFLEKGGTDHALKGISKN